MSDDEAVSKAEQTILRRAADTHLAIAFLHLVCTPDGMELDINVAELVNGADTDSKKAMLDQLQQVGAIKYAGNRWVATATGRELNGRFALLNQRR